MERVGVYNRCSTEEEAQLNALEVQAAESLDIVRGYKDWKLVDQYIESESGTTSKNRKEYLRMIDDIEAGKFTVIMIKSIDRLARNVKDWYLFLDCITRNNVKLYLYLENKFYSPEDSIITGIKAILAEDFSRELSKKIKNAHRRRQKLKSGLNISREMFGWDKVEKNVYKINEEEAVHYREAIDMAENGMGFTAIAIAMAEKGVRGKKGEVISAVQWRNMIRSPRVHGTVLLHTNEMDFNRKERIKVPESEWIFVEDALPAIISKEHHERVLAILDERAERANSAAKRVNKVSRHELGGKIKCADCGKVYYRLEKKNDAVWRCKEYVNYGVKNSESGLGCDNTKLAESKLYKIIDNACKEKMKGIAFESQSLIDETIKILRRTFTSDKTEKEQKKLESRRNKLQSDKDKLMEKLMDGVISDEDFKFYNLKFNNELESIEEKLEELSKSKEKVKEQEERLQEIKKELVTGSIIEDARAKEFRSYIKQIVVHNNGDLDIELDINKLMRTNIFDKDMSTIRVNYFRVKKTKNLMIEDRERIYQIIKEDIYITRPEICKIMNLGRHAVDNRLKELREEGRISYEFKGTPHWIVYEQGVESEQSVVENS